jgi:predicted O-methyltransferase YrrM
LTDPNRYWLYEGDKPLGPARQLHDDIRREGAGRFSIWGEWVYLSSSDNSDPRQNQRNYSLLALSKKRPPPESEALNDLSLISMLCAETLGRLAVLASHTRGGILEIGSYVGGSTIALARGNRGNVPHAVIEAGGAYDHAIASADIHADWQKNMEAHGFAGKAKLCKGWSHNAAVRSEALEHIGKIGLLFVDADGKLSPIFRYFSAYMQPDCLLALDDYVSIQAAEKSSMVRPFIDRNVAAGRLIPQDVVGGTWFGRVSGQEALDYFQTMLPLPVEREIGFAFAIPVPYGPVDSPDAPTASQLRLFEDGVELGPAHCSHKEIRRHGLGRFSHWAGEPGHCLYMSTSDNTDPRENGRIYTATVGGEAVQL